MNQCVVQPDVGDGQGDEQQELSGSHHVLGAVGGIEANRRLHPLVVGCRLRHRCGRRHRMTQGLDDASGRDVLGAPIYHVECLVTLVGAGVGVRVVVDRLCRPLGVIEVRVV
jgi:hypothetical protein